MPSLRCGYVCVANRTLASLADVPITSVIILSIYMHYPVFKERIFSCSIEQPPGNVLLSRSPSGQVPSALEGLTAVFGMGTGVSPPPSSPDDAHGCASACVATGRRAFSRPSL